MRLELPVLSFVSVASLILILPGQVQSFSIPSVSIIAWFFFCNLIHGINAILWSGNQSVHAPVWCDISSVVLLGAMVALPSCFLCISRRLEAITSIHKVEQKSSKIYDRAFEAVVCFLFPALYMSLHTIVQDHRFVILEDYGCQAAVYNSLPALIIVWSPPLCISVIGIFYCVSAVINVSKYRGHYNSSRSKPDISLSLFTRRIAFAIGGMLYVAAVYAYVLSSIISSGLLPWLSVSQTRSQVMDIDTVPSPSQMSIQSELIWWFIPVWSLLLCILCALGKETQNGYYSTFNWLSKGFQGDISILPLHKRSSTTTIPVHLLRSGWDDDLDLDSPFASFRSKRFSFFKKTESTRSSTPSPPPESYVSVAPPTINYFTSSTAQDLRSPSPNVVQDYAPFASPPKRPMVDTLAMPPTNPDGDSIRSSLYGSILSGNGWPRPPESIHSPIASQASSAIADHIRPSSPLSSRSSLGSTIADVLGAIPAHLRDVPFNRTELEMTTAPTLQRPRPVHKGSKKKKSNAIHMMVVHETITDSDS